jgi:hypothetical protein
MVNGSKPQSAGHSPGVKPHPQILRRTSAPFPLTPALSLGEREHHRPCSGTVEVPRIVARRGANLPLPEGERVSPSGLWACVAKWLVINTF